RRGYGGQEAGHYVSSRRTLAAGGRRSCRPVPGRRLAAGTRASAVRLSKRWLRAGGRDRARTCGFRRQRETESRTTGREQFENRSQPALDSGEPFACVPPDQLIDGGGIG